MAIKSSISCFSDISFVDDYGLLVFNATFNNISVIDILLQWSLLMEDAGVPGENLRPVASHWQTLSYNVVSSAYRHVQELPTYFVIIPILHILFFYSIRFGTLKSDSTHHFFRNACTKSGSLRFSQFSGCWLILSVYVLMTFEFPFVRLLGVR